MDHLRAPVDPYAIPMVPKTSVADHISLLYAAMVANMQDLFLEFHDVLTCTRRLLRTLPLTTLWYEFRLCYHNFMVTGDPEVDEERFHILVAWATVPESCR